MPKKRSIKRRIIKGGSSSTGKTKKPSSSPTGKPRSSSSSTGKPKRKSTGNTQRQSSGSSGKKSKRNPTNQTTKGRTRRNVLHNLKPTVRVASYNDNTCDVYIEQISKMELEKQNIKQFLKVLEEKIKTNNKKNDTIIKKYETIIQDFKKETAALKHKEPIVEQPLARLAGKLAGITNELLGYKEAMKDIRGFLADSGKPNYLLQWENRQRMGEQTYEKPPVAKIYQSSPTHNAYGNPLYSPGSVEKHNSTTNFLPVFQPKQQPHGTPQNPLYAPDGSIAI